nr:MAG: capsid protein [Smacoviridae sp.]
MARRYYRRTRVVRPKKKWASNMKQGTLNATTPIAILVENSLQGSSPTPVVVKAGNFKIQGDLTVYISAAAAQVARMTLLVFWLPEGLTADSDAAGAIVSNHPEWILAWKQLDTVGSTSQGNLAASGFSFSSRLKRNLNSGDKICIAFLNDTSAAQPTIKYTCQYWTCAN